MRMLLFPKAARPWPPARGQAPAALVPRWPIALRFLLIELNAADGEAAETDPPTTQPGAEEVPVEGSADAGPPAPERSPLGPETSGADAEPASAPASRKARGWLAALRALLPSGRRVEGRRPTPHPGEPAGGSISGASGEPDSGISGILGQPRAWRILDGDAAALELAAAELAGSEAGRDRWRSQLEILFEAILEEALKLGYVNVPPNHPFWGIFTPEQRRLILGALASIGFRFDGLGGWLHERVPAKRDLSVALGYAGVDPVRIRSWPSPEELRLLVARASIAGREYLTAVAPGLTLAELDPVLAGRGSELEGLVAVWDEARAILLAID